MNQLIENNLNSSKKIFSINEARTLAKKRLPKLIFDFVDGGSGDEKLSEINHKALDQIRLEPKVLRNVEKRNLKKTFLNIDYDHPFGFAPMGMCNLTCMKYQKAIPGFRYIFLKMKILLLSY